MSISKKDYQDYLEFVAEHGHEGLKNSTPAVLFYQEDFATGVADMTMEERGMYITLLTYQNIKGRMSKDYIDRICPGCSEYVMEKFSQDENGLCYNERMEFEIFRRVKKQLTLIDNFSQKDSQKGNQKASLSETETVTETETENKDQKEDSDNNEIVADVVDYLNMKLGSKYKASSKATKRAVNARINEGYNIDDFIKVIDKKYDDWHDDEKMSQYLTPDTLFGTKFEKYLNQPKRKRKRGNEVLDLLEGGLFT